MVAIRVRLTTNLEQLCFVTAIRGVNAMPIYGGLNSECRGATGQTIPSGWGVKIVCLSKQACKHRAAPARDEASAVIHGEFGDFDPALQVAINWS